ncbi:hypothetical protein [Bifidobacterium adolescentis]|uniref:hypothetical protein n=1 Tax=Bifidobacterium adolescentis TaxID=1680 RepID=UPI003CE51E1A
MTSSFLVLHAFDSIVVPPDAPDMVRVVTIAGMMSLSNMTNVTFVDAAGCAMRHVHYSGSKRTNQTRIGGREAA